MKGLVCCCLVFLPLKYLYLTSHFGYRVHPVTGKYAFHSGTDLRAKHDTVYAILDGLVKQTGYNNLLGLNITLAHDSLESVYGHLSQILVNAGETVKAGDPIGITGATGRVTGEHLHFSIRYKNQYLDPMQFLYGLLITKNHE